MSEKKVQIDICIATFKRAELLEKLLESLIKQQINNKKMSYRIIVIDNDKNASAKNVINKLKVSSPVKITYDIEPQQNISLVRNCAIRHVTGDYLIFIDDDEYADKSWLVRHYETAIQYNADVVFGPVISIYPVQTPNWIKKGKFFEKERYKTGTVRLHGATNNTLVKTLTLKKMEAYFDPTFGLTGGGDTEFFWRMGNKGAKMIWCDTAIVSETVPPARMTSKWLVRRAYRSGQMYPRIFCLKMPLLTKILWIIKRFSFLIIACLYLPIAACLSKSARIKALQKVYSCLGHLTGFTRFYYQEYRQN